MTRERWVGNKIPPKTYSNPEEWQEGDRCPFCLASDGPWPYAIEGPNHGRLGGCGVCWMLVSYPDDDLYRELPFRFNYGTPLVPSSETTSSDPSSQEPSQK